MEKSNESGSPQQNGNGRNSESNNNKTREKKSSIINFDLSSAIRTVTNTDSSKNSSANLNNQNQLGDINENDDRLEDSDEAISNPNPNANDAPGASPVAQNTFPAIPQNSAPFEPQPDSLNTNSIQKNQQKSQPSIPILPSSVPLQQAVVYPQSQFLSGSNSSNESNLKEQMIFFELDEIIFKAPASKAKLETWPISLNSFIAETEKQFTRMSDHCFMNEERDIMLQIIPAKDCLSSEKDILTVRSRLAKILAALEGGSEELLRYFEIAQFSQIVLQGNSENEEDSQLEKNNNNEEGNQILAGNQNDQKQGFKPENVVFLLEVKITGGSLCSALGQLDDRSVPEVLVIEMFNGLIDMLLQLHARYEVVGKLRLHSIFFHQNLLFLLDFTNSSFILDPKSLVYDGNSDSLCDSSKKDHFKQDIYDLATTLLALHMNNIGYSFQACKEILPDHKYVPKQLKYSHLFKSSNQQGQAQKQPLQDISEENKDNQDISENKMDKQSDKQQEQGQSVSQSQRMASDLAKKHNCNAFIVKTPKFIAIEEGKIQLYQIPNILAGMLEPNEQARISSLKLSMLCQRTHLFLRNVVYTYESQFPSIVSQGNNNIGDASKIRLFPFKPLQSIISSSDNRTTILLNEEEIFSGFLDSTGFPTEYCSIRIFQNFTLEGIFMSEQRCLQASLKYEDITICQGDCYNYIFKQWLINTSTLQEIIINGLVQIQKRDATKKGKELQNVVMGSKEQQVVKLNQSYLMEEKVFDAMESILQQIETLNLNNIDFLSIIQNSPLFDISRLMYLQHLILAVDTDRKASFLQSFLQSSSCEYLEILDLSNSSRLDFQDFVLAKQIGGLAKTSSLKELILKNCKSSCPSIFLSALFMNDSLKRINSICLDDTYVDLNFFNKLLDSSYVTSVSSLSLNDTSGITDASVTTLSEKLYKFKNMKFLNISGMLKKNFNKSLFSDSNITAFKKLAGNMNTLFFMEIIVFDDSYLNDTVLEIMSKCNMPSLTKIYLRNQSRVTYKGLSYILQSSNFRNLRLINCNCSSSITLPRGVLSPVEISVLGCKAITSQNVSDYLRSNSGAHGIRFDARNLNSDVIASINLTKYLKKVSIFCGEVGDPARVVNLLKCLDQIKKLNLILCFHYSKSFIPQRDYEYLGQKQFKKNVLDVNQLSSELKSLVYTAHEQKLIGMKLIECIHIHKVPYQEYFSQVSSLESVDISSFMSLPIPALSQIRFLNDQQSQNLLITRPKQTLDLSSVLLVQANRSSIESSLNQSLERNSFVDDSKRALRSQRNHMQYLEDLRVLLLSNNSNITSWSTLDLSQFNIGAEELHMLALSDQLSNIRTLVLCDSYLRGNDLQFLSDRARSLSSLMLIDLSNNRLPFISGLVNLVDSPQLPSLRTIKLGTYKLKIFLKSFTAAFSQLTLLLTASHNLPKFNTENKIKVSVLNNPANKKYLETLDFYIKRRVDQGSEKKIPIQPSSGGILKVIMNAYTFFYFNNCQKFPEQTHNLHRLMKFQYGIEQSQTKEKSNKSNDDDVVRLCIAGHELAGKKALADSYVNSYFGEEREKEMADLNKPIQRQRYNTQINCGVKSYITLAEIEGKKSEVLLNVLQSSNFFTQLRMSLLRQADGIVLVYDSSKKDLQSEMAQFLQEVRLLKLQKPVFLAANSFAGKVPSEKLISTDINMFFDVTMSNPLSVKKMFTELAAQALESKSKKPIFTDEFLILLCNELAFLSFDEVDLRFDFLRVRNEIEFEAMRDFCVQQRDNEQINKLNLIIRNWGSHGKSSEDILNKISGAKINVKILSSLQSQQHTD